MSRRGSPPSSARVLTQWVDAYARERGLPPKRVRDWISYMILGGRLERASVDADRPQFTIKGAVAIELRLPDKARATRDIDLVVEDPAHAELTVQLRNALEGSYQGFAFRVKGKPTRCRTTRCAWTWRSSMGGEGGERFRSTSLPARVIEPR